MSVLLCDADVWHRRLVVDFPRMLNPAHHIIRGIEELARQITLRADACEWRSNLPVSAGDPGNQMTGAAAITLDRRDSGPDIAIRAAASG